jgi:hypothetical protein
MFVKKRVLIMPVVCFAVAAVVACSGHSDSWHQGFNYAQQHPNADQPTATDYCTGYMEGFNALGQQMSHQEQSDWVQGCIAGYSQG